MTITKCEIALTFAAVIRTWV